MIKILINLKLSVIKPVAGSSKSLKKKKQASRSSGGGNVNNKSKV